MMAHAFQNLQQFIGEGTAASKVLQEMIIYRKQTIKLLDLQEQPEVAVEARFSV